MLPVSIDTKFGRDKPLCFPCMWGVLALSWCCSAVEVPCFGLPVRMLALEWMLPSASWSLAQVPHCHRPACCLHLALACCVAWTRRQCDTRPGLAGCTWPWAPGPPASGPLCLLGPGPWPSRAGWGWRSTPFGVGMSPGCTGMPQGPPICVKRAIRARGARFSGPLPLVTL